MSAPGTKGDETQAPRGHERTNCEAFINAYENRQYINNYFRMKFTRKASAHWKGTGKDGSGTVSTQSTVLDQTAYSYKTRFEDGVGTNPEELIGAAHAGCFAMQLSFLLSEKGYEP